jgi:hypothetical protein
MTVTVLKTHINCDSLGVVQSCFHSPHVATGDLNVLTESCSEVDCYLMTNTLYFSQVLTKVATAKPV